MQSERTVSLVAARRELGRLAEEVRRTGQPLILTRRGRAVARLVPAPSGPRTRGGPDAFATLRGTVRLGGNLAEIETAVHEIRTELAGNLERRARPFLQRRVRRHA